MAITEEQFNNLTAGENKIMYQNNLGVLIELSYIGHNKDTVYCMDKKGSVVHCPVKYFLEQHDLISEPKTRRIEVAEYYNEDSETIYTQRISDMVSQSTWKKVIGSERENEVECD